MYVSAQIKRNDNCDKCLWFLFMLIGMFLLIGFIISIPITIMMCTFGGYPILSTLISVTWKAGCLIAVVGGLMCTCIR